MLFNKYNYFLDDKIKEYKIAGKSKRFEVKEMEMSSMSYKAHSWL